jgi:predicted transposase YbfD/YdcC
LRAARRCAGSHRAGRQDLAAQPRPGRGQGRAASGLGLRDRREARSRPGAVEDKSNETTAIPALLERLAGSGALAGALVTIDAIACNPKIARDIVDKQTDHLLAVKDNQPTLHAEIKSFFDDAPPETLDTHVESDKGHGRIEQRRGDVSHAVDWMTESQRLPGEHRFPKIAALIRIEARVEHKNLCTREHRYYISSRALTAEQAARAMRAYWQIENALHWVLDVTFKEDLARLRKGHGAQNMATLRHFAINIVRNTNDKRSIKLRRKIARWDTNYLYNLLKARPVNLDSLPWGHMDWGSMELTSR